MGAHSVAPSTGGEALLLNVCLHITVEAVPSASYLQVTLAPQHPQIPAQTTAVKTQESSATTNKMVTSKFNMPAPDASAGVKAAPLPDSDISQAAALHRTQLSN